MERALTKKLSILGLVLMIVSAITAAVLPGRSDNKRPTNNNNGTLRIRSAEVSGPAVFSCTPETEDDQSCTATVDTITSRLIGQSPIEEEDSYFSTWGNQYQTSGNTSNTFAIPDPGGMDQTSISRKI